MKAALIRRYGGPDVVELADVDEPRPGPDDLLVEVRAASVNPLDFKLREGQVKRVLKYEMPLVLGNDLSGVVREVGANVKRFAPGDAIYARLDKDRIGAFAELALVRESAAAQKPRRLDHMQAASLPLVGLTSWQALVELAHVGEGSRVLIHAGAGGVGTFAIQLARHLGAARIATTASPRNEALVRRLGATEVIDYRSQRFEEVLDEVDVVFDVMGSDTLERSFRVVRRGGVVVTVGGLPDARFAREWGMSSIFVLALGFLGRKVTRLAKQRGAAFHYLFSRADGETLGRIAQLVDEGAIEPVIDRTYPVEQIRDALEQSASGKTTGKIVITMG